MITETKPLRIGFAMTGSFCTFGKVLNELEKMCKNGWDITPIMSETAYSTDTRFGAAANFVSRLEDLCGNPVIHTISAAEPIGPKKLLDVIVVAPCTGNTLAKLSAGIADTSVTLAVKAHLRNQRPVILAVSSNDALGAGAKNIGSLMNSKNIFFVPMGQDDSESKPNSIVAHFDKITDTIFSALKYSQTQPLI